MFCETLKDATAELHAQRHGQNIQIFVWHINCQQWFQQSTKLMLLCIGVEVDRNRLWQVNILIHLWKPIIHLINGWLHRGPLLAFRLTFAHSNIFLNFPSLWPASLPNLPMCLRTHKNARTNCFFLSQKLSNKNHRRLRRRRLPAIKVSHFDINFNGFYICCVWNVSVRRHLKNLYHSWKKYQLISSGSYFLSFFLFDISHLDTQCVENKSHETFHSGSSLSPLSHPFLFFRFDLTFFNEMMIVFATST